MNKRINWELLASYVVGECSKQEEREVKIWLQLNPDNRRLMDSLEQIWNAAGPPIQEFDKKAFWAEVKYKAGIALLSNRKARILPIRHHITNSRIWKIAAILFITFSLPYLVKKAMNVRTSPPQMKEVVVEKTKRTTVTLADGSRVTLDAGSVLSYTSEFRGQTREIFLQGEGYFEVSPNPQVPFIVHANDAVIEVLGTEFNVRAWPQNRNVKVVVAEGNVSIRSKNDTEEEAVVISKGQFSMLRENDKPTKPHQVDVEKYLAWLNYELFFEDTPLSEVVDQLSRWYDLEFYFASDSIVSLPFTTHFKNKPIEDILESICVVLELQYERDGNTVILSSRNRD